MSEKFNIPEENSLDSMEGISSEKEGEINSDLSNIERIKNVDLFKQTIKSLKEKAKEEDLEVLDTRIAVAEKIFNLIKNKFASVENQNFQIEIDVNVDPEISPELKDEVTGFNVYGSRGRFVETGTRKAKQHTDFGSIDFKVSVGGDFFSVFDCKLYFSERSPRYEDDPLWDEDDLEIELDTIIKVANSLK